MDKHYARLVELSQVKGDYTANKQVFLDAMYIVGLCYIHNVKIKEISMGNNVLRIIFDSVYFYFWNSLEYIKYWDTVPEDYVLMFKREELKDVFLNTFLPMPKNKKIG